MIAGAIVVDAVVHPYNLDPANQNPAAQEQLEAVYGAHVVATGPDHPEHLLTRDEFFSDFPFEAIADSLFVESPVDLAIIHALPNLGFAREHVTDPDRAAAFRDRYPDRFRLYATVDTPATDAAIAQLERQVRELGVDAAPALDIGLVNRIVEPDALIPAATELAGRIAAKSWRAVEATKQSLRRVAGRSERHAEHELLGGRRAPTRAGRARGDHRVHREAAGALQPAVGHAERPQLVDLGLGGGGA